MRLRSASPESRPSLVLSASDLGDHLGCPHLTTLELAAAAGELRRPFRDDPHLEVLRLRGAEHERAYLDHLRAAGLQVVEIPAELAAEAAAARTAAAMARGVDAIAQGTLIDGWRVGRADVLRRVERPSRLGGWSYEPVDTKLARETRGATMLQLCLYADLLEAAQGVWPEQMHVVVPGRGFEPESHRVAEYLAYYRRVKGSLERAVGVATVPAGPDDAARPRAGTYPSPCGHCDVCRWWQECDRRWRADDHLCLVAGMRRSAERELGTVGVRTLAGLAAWSPPQGWRPQRGARGSYAALGRQARLQHESRGVQPPIHERVLPVVEGEGLARLPVPARGDLFLDLEGDPFCGEGGQEYLFGLVSLDATGADAYRGWWALDRESERDGFAALLDEVMARWQADPGLHVYHFGHYEPSALKRLASRHGVRGEELDRLLRAGRFVDLHRVVRQGIRAGVESYSIKKLEALYGYAREAPLRDSGRVRAELEAALEVGRAADVEPAALRLVELYNRDDCRSTRALRDWLEAQRAALEAEGVAVPRPPEAGPGDPTERVTERLARLRAAAEPLLEGVPAERASRDAEQQARWLLGHSLGFNRREENVGWWELFRLAELDDEERRDEPCAIAGLQFEHELPLQGKQRVPVHRYRFPLQEVDWRYDGVHVDADKDLGEVIAHGADWVEIKKRGDTIGEHPTSVFLWDRISAQVKEDSLLRLASWVGDQGFAQDGPYRAACDLLLGRTARGCARVTEGLRRSGEPAVDAARRLVRELDGGVLPIQGPPGSGKTYTGARMVVELVRNGKKVGITALSHKVIRNLVDAVEEAAREEGVPLSCLVKVMDPEPATPGAAVVETGSNPAVRTGLDSGKVQVAAGTAWLWSRPEMAGAVDVLFVDEAGQMSLADALAVAPAAPNLVLLGDPQQLEQPVQAAHPEGCDVTALAHLLQGPDGTITPTMPRERGLFLDQTWRLHPAICGFTSEQFYEGRLASRPGLERQSLHAPALLYGSGLYFVPVDHGGCQNTSEEEADAVAALVRSWLDAGAEWTDREGLRQRLELDDVLIVAPYNAQLALLKERLPGGRIGTVDKFQGQEAPVVVYSMTTSSPEEAPRGMEFLYNRNRLNVATSRARCACVVVASPRLLEPECRTPRQMRLANALCRFVEMARVIGGPTSAHPAERTSRGGE